MKTLTHLAVALLTTTLIGAGTATMAPAASAATQQGKPDQTDKAVPPGQAKKQEEPAGTPKTKKTPKPKKTTKPKQTSKPKKTTEPKQAGKPAGSSDTRGNGGGSASGGNGPAQASRNENKKITYCHVPPGNPDNGHLITTSVNAITPGHTNHPGDIIPPFSFVKHGVTVDFAGQNWDAAGQATLANGCDPVASSFAVPATPDSTPAKAGVPGAPTPGTSLVTAEPPVSESTTTATSTTSASLTDVPEDDESIVEAFLPNTGGARLAFLVAGVALLAGGIVLVTRRRSLT